MPAQSPLIEQVLGTTADDTPAGTETRVAAKPDPVAEVEAKRAEISERLEVARRAQEISETPAETAAEATAPAADEVELLKRLDVLVAQQKTALERQAELANAERIAAEKLEGSAKVDSISRHRIRFFYSTSCAPIWPPPSNVANRPPAWSKAPPIRCTAPKKPPTKRTANGVSRPAARGGPRPASTPRAIDRASCWIWKRRSPTSR